MKSTKVKRVSKEYYDKHSNILGMMSSNCNNTTGKNPSRLSVKTTLQIDGSSYSSLSAPFLLGSSTNASVSCSSDMPCKYGFNGGGLQNDPFLNIRKSSVLHLVGASPYKKREVFLVWCSFISLCLNLSIVTKILLA